MPTLNTGEMYYNGVTLGPAPFWIQSASGLADYPEVRTSDRALLRRHGLFAGDDFLGGRTLTVEVAILSDVSVAATHGYVENFRRAFAPGGPELPLNFVVPGLAGSATGRIMCRPRKLSMATDGRHFRGFPVGLVELYATSPVIEREDAYTLVTTLPTAGGGLGFPVSFPISFGAQSTGGSIYGYNGGNFPASVNFRIDGPATNPKIEHVGQSKSIQVNIDLAAGEYLILDSKARTVMLMGTASRYNLIAAGSSWFDMGVGSNELRFSAATTTAATLTAVWRDTWV